MRGDLGRRRLAGWGFALGLVAAGVLGFVALALVVGLALAAVAIGLVAQRLRRAEAARAAAEAASEAAQIAARRRLADALECQFRGFAETMAATAARFVERSLGVAETARTARDGSRDGLGDGAQLPSGPRRWPLPPTNSPSRSARSVGTLPKPGPWSATPRPEPRRPMLWCASSQRRRRRACAA